MHDLLHDFLDDLLHDLLDDLLHDLLDDLLHDFLDDFFQLTKAISSSAALPGTSAPLDGLLEAGMQIVLKSYFRK